MTEKGRSISRGGKEFHSLGMRLKKSYAQNYSYTERLLQFNLKLNTLVLDDYKTGGDHGYYK